MSAQQNGQRVVVGVDGSDGARHALAWALDKVARFGPVTPVTTFLVGPFADGIGTFAGADPTGKPYREEAAAHLLKALDAVDAPLSEQAELSARAEVIEHRAGPGLVQASAEADLLVVGSRGRSAVVETVLGSVGSYCVRHASVPVAVIPREAQAVGPLSRLVVGVDGSENGRAALEWALRHADRDGTVVAVGVFSGAALASEGYVTDSMALERETRELVEADVATVSANVDESPKVEIEIRPGDPRLELPKAAQTADLLVIGARGHRGVAYLLLGSVTTALTHHPVRATVVVPHC